MERECDEQGPPMGHPEATLAVTENEEGPHCKSLGANSRLTNLSCNSSKRIGMSRPYIISAMDL